MNKTYVSKTCYELLQEIKNNKIKDVENFLKEHSSLDSDTKQILINATLDYTKENIFDLLTSFGLSSLNQEKLLNAKLRFAAKNNNIELSQSLIKENANVNDIDSNGNAPLMFAAQNGHIQATKFLLDHNANINLQDSDGWTALFFASYNYKPEAVALLINQQADINHKDNKNLNALICMLNRNPLDSFDEEIIICKQLMMAGIDVNSIPIETIRTCTQDKHFEVKFSLIKNKIVRAIQSDNQEEQCCYINYLITGKNSLKTIPHGTTALMLASGAGYNHLVVEMLNANAQINQTNAKGFTALTYASLHNKIDAVEELLKQKAEVNHVSLVDGSTPLHHAAYKGHTEIAKLLIKNNADYNLKDMDNNTPLTLATNNGHQSAIDNVIIGLLEEDISESSSSNQI